MNVIVACEQSQEVTEAFIKAGHNAMSCDLNYPGAKGLPHYQGDIFDLDLSKYDLMIAHPPCTYLTVSNSHMKRGCTKYTAEQAVVLRQEAAAFFMKLVNAPVKKKAIENPIGVMSTLYQKPTQIIRPFQFGGNSTKATCLWLENLPKLQPTNIIVPETHTSKTGKVYDKWWFESSLIRDLEERAKFRSATFPGIALAFSSQWGRL